MTTIRERRAQHFCDGKDTDALLALVDELVEAMRLTHGSSYHQSMMPRCPGCRVLAHAKEVTDG